MRKTCITLIPTHPRHPMLGIRIALADAYRIKRGFGKDDMHQIQGEFVPHDFGGMLAAKTYLDAVLKYTPLASPKLVTYEEAMKYGQQEAEMLAGKIQVPYLPND